MTTTALAALAAAILLHGAGAQDTLALTGFRLLDVEEGRAVQGDALLIADGVIVWRGRADELATPAAVRRIDGRGRTLVPGLIDAHAHTDSLSLGLFLAAGVTGVREANGSERHLRWREEIAAGELLGPRLLVTSELLAGTAVEGVRHRLIDGARDARTAALEAVGAGYEFLKIYDGLDTAEYRALVKEASAAGLRLTGHIPADVGLDGVLAAGQGLEHAEKIVNDVLGHDLGDLDILASAAARIAAAGVPVAPTLAVQEVLNRVESSVLERVRSAGGLDLVSEGTRGWWSSVTTHPPQATSPGQEPWPWRYQRAQRLLVLHLQEAGAPILAGTDTPNPYMVPGSSLHDELEALVRAGLSPREALAAGTVTPGDWLPFQVPTGRIAPGYAADLVAVEGDPLSDVSVLRRPWAVMTAGRWLERSALDAMRAEVRAARSSR